MNFYDHVNEHPEDYITQEEYIKYFGTPRTIFSNEIEEKIRKAHNAG